MVEASEITGAALHKAISHTHRSGERLYAVVDAARDKKLAFAAERQYGQTIRWLFDQGAGPHMVDVAPYLVPIKFESHYPFEGSGYLDLWASRFGRSAGILLLTSADFETLWQHLRSVFLATDESKDEPHRYYFRFYDPRVLRGFLPCCSPAEAVEFFGPSRKILLASEDATALVYCDHGPSGVTMDSREFAGGKAKAAGRAESK